MKKIGLTGGIGSGKTMVAKLFEALDIPVYYADITARNLLNNDPELKAKIISLFGEEVYREGRLDRAFLGSIVFNDRLKLEQLNALVHPATIHDAERWMNQQQAPYVIKEAAILFETGSAEQLDLVIGVTAPEPIRIKRVMDRDGLSLQEIRKRMDHQINESMKMKLCDFVITNDESELVIPQVLDIHKKILAG